jgi:integrase
MRLTAPAIAKLRPSPKGRTEIPDSACPGLFLLIQESGVKSFAGRYRRPNGKSAKLTLGRIDLTGEENGSDPVIGAPLTLAGARRLWSQCKHQIALGRDPAADYFAERDRRKTVALEKTANTFASAVRHFVDEYRVPRKGRKPRGWQEGARILGLDYPAVGEPAEVEGGLAQRWRDKPISEIDGHDVYSVIDEARRRGIPGMQKRNEGMSDNRGRKMHAELSRFFGWLLQHRRITTDPTVGVWHPGVPPARERVLNCKVDVRRADELRWFWAATGQLAEPWPQLLRMLLIVGCRRDEVREMRWDELSDDFSMMRLPGERTKNGLPHNVPLPPLVQELLRSVRHIEGSAFVFTGASGMTPVSNGSKTKRRLDELMLIEARKERGDDFTIEPFVIHDLRRTCATGMAGIKVPPHVVEACLNHVSGSKASVAGVYNRETYEPEKKEALERWAEYIERITTGEIGKVVTLQGRGRS